MSVGFRSSQGSRRALVVPGNPSTALRAALAAVALCVAAASLGAASVVGREPGLDPSDVVLVFDFSDSILRSKSGANVEFARALDKIADRVKETSADLVKGHATISFEAFGRKAVLYERCTDIALSDNSAEVQRLEGCLRSIAREYRAGKSAPIAKKVGSTATDHVAALTKAATLLPPGAARPAVIFFTDGQNDPPGSTRDKEDVAAKIRPRYKGHDPLAILPVGLGKIATKFETELQAIHIQNFRGMDPCAGRERFEWPRVVFPSPEAAGLQVAVALQEVTCSFTVKPTPTPSPTPTPVPTPIPAKPGAPQAVAAEPTNEGLHLTWQAPANPGTGSVTGYFVHCRRTDTGSWGPQRATGSTLAEDQLNGLEAGYPYECQVAANNAVGQGDWSASSAATAPLGLPPAPGKPSAEAGNAQARVSVPDPGQLSGLADSYRFECADAEAGAPIAARAAERSTTVTGLTNGNEYTCVAYAENHLGQSSASPVSDSFRPCSNLFECSPWTRWFSLLLGLLLAFALAWLLIHWLRGPRHWFVAVLDGGEATRLGWGPKIGARIEREGTGFVVKSYRSPTAPIRVRDRGGDFVDLTSPEGQTRVRPGQSATVTDDDGGTHDLVLRRYSQPPKSPKVPGVDDDPWSSSTTGASTNTSSPTDDSAW